MANAESVVITMSRKSSLPTYEEAVSHGERIPNDRRIDASSEPAILSLGANENFGRRTVGQTSRELTSITVDHSERTRRATRTSLDLQKYFKDRDKVC